MEVKFKKGMKVITKLICVKSGLCSCCIELPEIEGKKVKYFWATNKVTGTGEINITINKFYYGELQANLFSFDGAGEVNLWDDSR